MPHVSRTIVMPWACFSRALESLSAAACPVHETQMTARRRTSFFIIGLPMTRILPPFRRVPAAANLLLDLEAHAEQQHHFEERDERVNRIPGEGTGIGPAGEPLIETPRRNAF